MRGARAGLDLKGGKLKSFDEHISGRCLWWM